jgi:translation initiation factor IF-3
MESERPYDRSTIKRVWLRPKLYPSQFAAQAAEIQRLLAAGAAVDLVVGMGGRETQAVWLAEDILRRIVVEVLGTGREVGPVRRERDSVAVRIDPPPRSA